MQDIIHLLPDSVANQIAAGEVVQRPASIVKELVENSVDAGAKSIQVLLVEGGKNSIQVIDDGKGMSETDARLAFERHATSKIRAANDLFALSTMGFRGEALASIAAVAQVELKTRQADEDTGTYIQIAGSKVVEQEPVACSVGSNFIIKNIFFNVPARRRFLKSTNTELNNCVTEFERIALTNPDLEFRLAHNGVDIYKLSPASICQRIVDMFGKKVNSEILPVNVETSIVQISGYIGKPESSRKKGALQYFFVNGRYMRHPYFHSAVMHPYANLIQKGEQVPYFIYMAVDPAAIDVNVHPTKTEIKFDNEQDIWQILSAVVKEGLGKFNNVPTIEFDEDTPPQIPVMTQFDRDHLPQYEPKVPASSYNPFEQTPELSHPTGPSYRASASVSHLQQQLWDDAAKPTEEHHEIYNSSMPHFQYQGKYIIVSVGSGLMIVDQRRAHIKVLYEEYMKNLKEQKSASQGLLFPEIIQLTRIEETTLNDIQEDVTNIGFDITNLGGGSYSINGTPAGLGGLSPVKLLHDLIYAAMENVSTIRKNVQSSIASTLANSAAIVYGQILSEDEMDNILTQLFRLPLPKYTPDGKPVYHILDTSAIDNFFRS